MKIIDLIDGFLSPNLFHNKRIKYNPYKTYRKWSFLLPAALVLAYSFLKIGGGIYEEYLIHDVLHTASPEELEEYHEMLTGTEIDSSIEKEPLESIFDQIKKAKKEKKPLELKTQSAYKDTLSQEITDSEPQSSAEQTNTKRSGSEGSLLTDQELMILSGLSFLTSRYKSLEDIIIEPITNKYFLNEEEGLRVTSEDITVDTDSSITTHPITLPDYDISEWSTEQTVYPCKIFPNIKIKPVFPYYEKKDVEEKFEVIEIIPSDKDGYKKSVQEEVPKEKPILWKEWHDFLDNQSESDARKYVKKNFYSGKIHINTFLKKLYEDINSKYKGKIKEVYLKPIDILFCNNSLYEESYLLYHPYELRKAFSAGSVSLIENIFLEDYLVFCRHIISLNKDTFLAERFAWEEIDIIDRQLYALENIEFTHSSIKLLKKAKTGMSLEEIQIFEIAAKRIAKELKNHDMNMEDFIDLLLKQKKDLLLNIAEYSLEPESKIRAYYVLGKSSKEDYDDLEETLFYLDKISEVLSEESPEFFEELPTSLQVDIPVIFKDVGKKFEIHKKDTN